MRCIVTAMVVLPFAAGFLLGTDTSTSGNSYVAAGGSDDNAGMRSVEAPVSDCLTAATRRTATTTSISPTIFFEVAR
jgi:hypothetical protein